MQTFNRIIYAVYDAAMSPEKWPSVLSQIGALFNAEGAVIIFYENAAPADFIFSENLQNAVRVYLDEEWWRHDIHAQRAIACHLTSGDVFSDYTIATPEEIESLPIYVDFFRRVGFGWLMSGVMLPDLDMLVALSLPRAKWKGAFSAAEMALLKEVARHVEQALRISLRISNLEATETSLLAALDNMEAGIYALNESSEIILANASGQEMLTNHFQVTGQHMTARAKDERLRFDALVAAARDAECTSALTQSCVFTGADGKRIVVWALPITKSGQGRIGMTGVARTLLLAMPVERNHIVEPAVLRDLFGLTLGEARLASLIGSGVAVRAAAGKLGVTEATARVVLKRVFQKLGVNRQAELVLHLSALGRVNPIRGEKPTPCPPR